MKKIIIGTLGALFASAIAVAVWSSNVRANDLLAMNVEALAGETYKEQIGEYITTSLGNNYHTYYIECITYEKVRTSGTYTSETCSHAKVNADISVAVVGEVALPKGNAGAELSADSYCKEEGSFEQKIVTRKGRTLCGAGEDDDCKGIVRYGDPCGCMLFNFF